MFILYTKLLLCLITCQTATIFISKTVTIYILNSYYIYNTCQTVTIYTKLLLLLY